MGILTNLLVATTAIFFFLADVPTAQAAFTSIDTTTWLEDSPGSFDVETDSETVGDSVSYSLDPGTPTWVIIADNTGVMSGNPTNSHVGVHTFGIRMENLDTSDVITQTFNLTVENVAPVVVNPVLWELIEDDTNPSTYTLDIESDDEYDGGVTYELQISQDGSGPIT